jgi:hypothetical protein
MYALVHRILLNLQLTWKRHRLLLHIRVITHGYLLYNYINIINLFLEFYDNLLLLRIKLQKCLALANTLPQDFDKITEEDKEVCTYDTVKDLEQYLTMVVKYQTELLAKNQNIKMM